MRRRIERFTLCSSAALIASCAAPSSPVDRGWVNERLLDAARAEVAESPAPDEATRVPEGVRLDDGLDADEAVALALFNNPELEVALAQLELSRADLLQAGLLRNPVLSLLFPLGPKQLEATLNTPVEALWQRERRLKTAALALESVGEDLVREGLSVARDARASYLFVLHARERVALTRELAALRARRAALEQLLVDAGDSAPGRLAELALARERAELTALDAASLEQRARLELARVLGLEATARPVLVERLDRPASAPAALAEREDLVACALASRPDLRAAELRLEGAAQRAGFTVSDSFALSVILDANAEGTDGFEMGPGIGVELPVFDRGQGRRAQGRAELNAAAQRYRALRLRIESQVLAALQDLEAARAAADRIRSGSLPAAQRHVAALEAAHSAGEATAVNVVEASANVLEEQVALLDRRLAEELATADLELAIGRRGALAPECAP